MGVKLFLDACTLIYLIESQEQLVQKTRLLITEALQNKAQLMVSRLSFLECRVLPLKIKDDDLLLRYNKFFTLSGLHVIELSEEVMIIGGMESYRGLVCGSSLLFTIQHFTASY